MLVKLNKYTLPQFWPLVFWLWQPFSKMVYSNEIRKTKLIDDFQTQLLANETKLHDKLQEIKKVLAADEIDEDISRIF